MKHCMILLLAAIVTTLCALPAAASESTNKPNIIYIMVDDAGYGDLSCYGQKLFKTPNIDSIAENGLKFTQSYAGDTVCAPSRCCLMSGYHTGHAEVRGNREVQPIGQEPISDGLITVAEKLKEAGYATGAFGKWGLGYPGSEGDPIKQGFDEFFGYNCQRNAHNFFPTHLFHNDKKIELDGKTYSQDLIAENSLRFIRENKDRPFFAYLPWTIPHAAMHCPEDRMAPFRKQFPEYEDVVGKYGGATYTNPVAAFAAMMTILDGDVGRVLELIKELGIEDNTLVVFTSDNGPHQEGGHRPDIFDSNGPLNGLKRSVTEGGIRVPMLAQWPGKIKPGTVTDHITGSWDFMPTACAIAGIDAPEGIDGISYLPTLLGDQDAQKQHKYLYWEFYEQGGKKAARMGKWKAVQRNVKKNPNGPIMLFNLETDLGEENDISGQHPEIVTQMREIFDDAYTPSEVFKW